MKTKSALITTMTTVAAVSALAFSGCADNRADEATDTGATEVAEASLADQIAAEKNAASSDGLEDKERELRDRERQLQKRERELASVERNAMNDARPARVERVAAPVPQPEPELVLVELAALTPMDVELLDPLSSETSAAGDEVAAMIVADIVQDGFTVVPAGSRLEGHVAELASAKKIGGQARITVLFDSLRLPSGASVPLAASFTAEGKNQTGKDAGTIAGATAGGAILGNVMKDDDKDKGTLVGAVLGAAVGTAIAAKNKADPVEVSEGTVVTVELDEPFAVEVEAQPDRSAGLAAFPRRY